MIYIRLTHEDLDDDDGSIYSICVLVYMYVCIVYSDSMINSISGRKGGKAELFCELMKKSLMVKVEGRKPQH